MDIVVRERERRNWKMVISNWVSGKIWLVDLCISCIGVAKLDSFIGVEKLGLLWVMKEKVIA